MVSEVFASVCGEGLNVGTMQLFIRLAECSPGCRHCQSKSAPAAEETFFIRPWPGPQIQKISNPINPARLIQKIEKIFPLNIFYSVSFIGGEPLCQAAFIREIAQMFHKKSVNVFADSQLPDGEAFINLYQDVDQWSLTVKNPGKLTTAAKNLRRMENILSKISPANCYLKIVVNSDDDPNEFTDFFSNLNLDDFTLVIQPGAEPPSLIKDWDTGTILEWIKTFQPYFQQIRWIPQVHKLLRIP